MLGFLALLGLVSFQSCDYIFNQPTLYGGPPKKYQPIDSDSVIKEEQQVVKEQPQINKEQLATPQKSEK